MVSSTHSSVFPPGTDRPIVPGGFNITDSVPLRTDYMSLDRRQVIRISCYTACNGQSSSIGVHAPSTGFSSANSSVRLDPQSIGYRTLVQTYSHPLPTNFPMNRFGSYDSCVPIKVQRSDSLRAGSQPLAHLHMNAVRRSPGGGGGVMDNNRSPGFTGTQPPLRSFLRPVDQMQVQQENQQHMARIQVQQQPQDAVRANVARDYAPPVNAEVSLSWSTCL
ncbi:hypothetical protein P879_07881 [Paragonimus westermani]|uniref:Uncharacterized protein n=1 Tax=Paragonimus westermani TaxID=34504 RepID=A0A8T0DNH7_9TREM|nr:hypothetical protein P879_07881 [Paragonimus westermani]